MNKPSPKMVRSCLTNLRRIHTRNEHAYRRFSDAARQDLAEFSGTPQFDYILRRIWMAREVDGQAFWERHIFPTLKSEYRRLEAMTKWLPEGSAKGGWITVKLVMRTLSLWQIRLPFPMTPNHAVSLLRNAGRLHDLRVQS